MRVVFNQSFSGSGAILNCPRKKRNCSSPVMQVTTYIELPSGFAMLSETRPVSSISARFLISSNVTADHFRASASA